MKKTKLFSLLIVMMLIFGATTAFAADSAVTFKGMTEGFGFAPGSEYTTTDLFDNFKNVMPGDKLTEEITFTNEATDCDYINVYLRAEVHDEIENPLSDKVAEKETVATMTDFLSQLGMKIYNGETLIYDASPDEEGALAENVLLGTLVKGEKLELKVELNVPASLGNKYANRVGEVDWVFLVEAIQFDKLTVHKVWEDNNYPERPESVTVKLLKDGEVSEEVVLNDANQWTYTWDELDDRYAWTVEEVVSEGYEVSYTSQDNTIFITNRMDYVPVVPPEPKELTVIKVWEDDDNERGNRPESVSVTLYNGDEAVEKVILDESNGWTYSWSELDGNGEWSVLETGIPKGYTPSYSSEGEVVVITNTETLIDTGRIIWPIPVLGGLGMMMMFFGIIIMKKNKKDVNA